MSDRLEDISCFSIELKAKQVVEGFLSGLHKSPFHGFSVEFADYRAYNVGESTRFIDWKLFARTDKLFIKNYQQETNLRCIIVMDNSASMCFPWDKRHTTISNPNKITFAIYAVATILQMLYKQRDAFGLSLLSDKIDYLSEIKSTYAHKRHIFTLLEDLLKKEYKSFPTNTDIAPLLHQLANQIHKRSLVIIFTDLLSIRDNDEDFIKSLQHLKFARHEILLFHVFDKSLEEGLKYKNRPYRFVDMETKEELKINPSEIREQYQQMMTKRFSQIHSVCNDMHIDYIDCDIQAGFEQVLIPYFYKRIRMR
ncbi:MAG: DUF58 domain-containing protein [Bacteroidales bacterium]